MDQTKFKFVAILNKKIEVGKLMNALGHMAVGMGASYPQKEQLELDNYTDSNGQSHGNLSDNPFIVLSADNSNQIRVMRKTLIESGVFYVDFTSTMTTGTFVEQRKKTAETPEENLEYYGICFFGEKEKLTPLTKKFSLWRS